MEIFIVIVSWTLSPWHASDSVLLVRHFVDRFQVFQITVKDQNLFLSTKLGLRIATGPKVTLDHILVKT